MKRLILIFCMSALLLSCNSSNISSTDNKPDVTAIATQMAQVECKAIALREQRFALADEIRFTQETMMQLKDTRDTAHLAAKLQLLNKQKEMLLRASLQLADQIKHRLDSILTHELTTAEAKAKFNNELNTALERDCACEEHVYPTAGVGKTVTGT